MMHSIIIIIEQRGGKELYPEYHVGRAGINVKSVYMDAMYMQSFAV